ncbi:MAG: hypothetical protein ACYC3Q_01180 [Gemmatimonadaceae bacterium]
MAKQLPPAPIAVRRVLAKLGADINAARRRRRLPLDVVADRALTTRQTIARIEHGDPRVAMGTWATVLFVLGLAGRLGDLAAPAQDELGLSLEQERLPSRIRLTPPATRPTGKPAAPARRKASDPPGPGDET